MPLSKNINTYFDVERVLNTARAHNGIRYELNSPGAAIQFRARCYNYRKLLAEQAIARSGNPPGFVPTTLWDDMIVAQDRNLVIISFGAVAGVLRDAEGRVVEPEPLFKDPGQAEEILSRAPEPAVDVTVETDLEREARLLMEKYS